MKLRQVELFLAVIDHGGFVAAAEGLNIAQPAVSAAVRRLEEDLGGPLLVRGARGVVLTPEGEVFQRHARALLAQVAATRREIAAMRALEAGELSLGAPAMVAGHLLPPVLDAFLAERPGVRLRVEQAGAEEIGERVLRGAIDLGITADWRTPEGLVTSVLQEHPMVAVVAEDAPLAARAALNWDELLAQPLLLFPRGYHQRTRVDEAARRRGVQPRVPVEAESLPLLLDLVRRGRGVATLLACAAQGVPGVRALALPDDAVVPIAVSRRAGAPLGALAETFLAHLAARLGRAGSS